MATLTQFDISYLQEAPTEADQAVVAFHRLHRMAALYYPSHRQFDIYECKAVFDLQWKRVGSWKPTSEYKNIIAVKALEAYSIFAFIGARDDGTHISFVGFDGSVKSNRRISHRTDPLCADYNQKTREFFVAFENGSLVCAYSSLKNNEFTITVKKVIKVQSDANQKPKQVVTQDLIAVLFVLTTNGNILCIDTTKFDLVYAISGGAFTLPPLSLHCDKFGTDFVVRCANADRTKEQLELWHPPEDYASCRIGRFDRFTIPISAKIVGLTFESVGLASTKTLLQITTLNRKVTLYSCYGATSVNLETEIALNIPANIWEKFKHYFYASTMTTNAAAVVGSSSTGDLFFLNLWEYFVSSCFLSSNYDPTINFSSVLLTSFCHFTTAIGIQLPSKKDQELNLNYIDLELALNPLNESSYSSMLEPGMMMMGDDEQSVMSETLTGALNNLAEANRKIDEQMSKSQIEFLDSISSFPTAVGTAPVAGGGEGITQEMSPVLAQNEVSTRVPPSHKEPDRLYPQHNFDFRDPLKNLRGGMPGRPPAIISELQTINFYPSFLINNPDTSKCQSAASQPIKHFQMIKPDGMLLTENYQLLMFTFTGLSYLSPELFDRKLTIDHHAFAFRNGFITAVTSLKDCLICDVNNINSPPLKLGFVAGNHVKITTVITADIQLRIPNNIPQQQQGNQEKEKKKSARNESLSRTTPSNTQKLSESEETVGKYIFLAAGDSEGNVHMFICQGNQTIIQTENFRAHAVGIKSILFTGDTIRPLWNIHAEYSASTGRVSMLSTVGSALVTTSIEGEVKVWQPFSTETKNFAMDKIFQNCQIRWKVAGVFVINRFFIPAESSAITLKLPDSKPSTAGAVSSNRKMREIVSVSLAPGCLNLLLAFTNGTIEEWALPGLIDTNDSTLSTMQKEIWLNTKLHSEEITSMRVFVHGPLSTLKSVPLLQEHERNAILARLSSFIRVPNRMKYTAGLTFQETKLLAGSSSLTTCSKDNTLVLWSFQPNF
jgi:hypothetical protein